MLMQWKMDFDIKCIANQSDTTYLVNMQETFVHNSWQFSSIKSRHTHHICLRDIITHPLSPIHRHNAVIYLIYSTGSIPQIYSTRQTSTASPWSCPLSDRTSWDTHQNSLLNLQAPRNSNSPSSGPIRLKAWNVPGDPYNRTHHIAGPLSLAIL